MKKINKALLGLGTLGAAVAPLASVVACGGSENVTNYKILPTYTAQADQLIALGIKPDYYPYQLDKTDIFGYLKNPGTFMEVQDQAFKTAFTNKIHELTPSARGTSWWNQQALDAGEKGSDPEYWTHMSGDFVMYEHYLLDDGAKKVEESIAPKHYPNPRTYVETNFRESRDPFTRLPKSIVLALLDHNDEGMVKGYDNTTPAIKNIVQAMLKVARDIEGLDSDSTNLSVDGKVRPSGLPQRVATDEESWLYNDFVYARHYHNDFMDNADFIDPSNKVQDWLLNDQDADSDWIFSSDKIEDEQISKLFFAATYQDSEEEIKKVSIQAYNDIMGKITYTSRHHPVYEQQEEIGGAPMFEGAQRDNLLYFYNTASKISDAFKAPGANDSQDEKDGYKHLQDTFQDDKNLWGQLTNARSNSITISNELRTRMAAIKVLVDKAQNPTYGIFTLAPGSGQSTIQSSSKYSFLYNELGFKQAVPQKTDQQVAADVTASRSPSTLLEDYAADADNNVPRDGATNTFFNMDDNGWWWNLGEGTTVDSRAANFKDAFDLGVVTVNNDNHNNATSYNNMKGDTKTSISAMFKNTGSDNNELDALTVDYNMWNEGIKTPFVMHMLLDHIVKQLEDGYLSAQFSASELTKAKNWGDYFTIDFVS